MWCSCEYPTISAGNSMNSPCAKLKVRVARKARTKPRPIRANVPPNVAPPTKDAINLTIAAYIPFSIALFRHLRVPRLRVASRLGIGDFDHGVARPHNVCRRSDGHYAAGLHADHLRRHPAD